MSATFPITNQQVTVDAAESPLVLVEQTKLTRTKYIEGVIVSSTAATLRVYKGFVEGAWLPATDYDLNAGELHNVLLMANSGQIKIEVVRGAADTVVQVDLNYRS